MSICHLNLIPPNLIIAYPVHLEIVGGSRSETEKHHKGDR